MHKKALGIWETEWKENKHTKHKHRQTKLWRETPNGKAAKDLVLKNSRISFSRKVGTVTGHGNYKYHDYIVSKGTVSKICDLCDGGYTQDAEHIFRVCEKFYIQRQIIFGNDRPDLRLITDAQLSTFMAETDFPWFPAEEEEFVDTGDRESVASVITNNSWNYARCYSY